MRVTRERLPPRSPLPSNRRLWLSIVLGRVNRGRMRRKRGVFLSDNKVILCGVHLFRFALRLPLSENVSYEHQALHSGRNASTGSIRMARRAGMQQAESVTAASINVTAMNVKGSEALTKRRKRPARRVRAIAPVSPATTPV